MGGAAGEREPGQGTISELSARAGCPSRCFQTRNSFPDPVPGVDYQYAWPILVWGEEK